VFPRCSVEIVQGDTVVGEICHIQASRQDGPRYNPALGNWVRDEGFRRGDSQLPAAMAYATRAVEC
jgi:hypothetical protein